MPALEFAPGVARVVFEAAISGEPIYNVMHVARADLTDQDPIPVEEINSLGTDLEDAWGSHMIPNLTSAYAMRQVVVTDLGSDTGLQSITSSTATGTSPNGPMPNNCAMCISYHVAQRYRGGHARSYLAGFDMSKTVDARHWNDTIMGAQDTAVLNFLAACPTGWQFVLLRRYRAKAKLTPPVALPILFGHPDKRIASQRRRLGKS